MLQEVMAQSLTQVYPIGLRHAEGDRVFRYARNGVSEARGGYALYGNLLDTEFGQTPGTHAAGATVITLTAVGTPTLNQFRDGYMIVSNPPSTYKIRSSTAVVGGVFTVTLYEGLAAQITATTEWVSVFSNMYDGLLSPRIIAAAAGYGGFVGVPLFTITASYYCWVQTWGPCMIASYANYGTTPQLRGMFFHQDGSVISWSAGLSEADQYAGFMMPLTYVGGAHNVNAGAQMIMLQISN